MKLEGVSIASQAKVLSTFTISLARKLLSIKDPFRDLVKRTRDVLNRIVLDRREFLAERRKVIVHGKEIGKLDASNDFRLEDLRTSLILGFFQRSINQLRDGIDLKERKLDQARQIPFKAMLDFRGLEDVIHLEAISRNLSIRHRDQRLATERCRQGKSCFCRSRFFDLVNNSSVRAWLSNGPFHKLTS